MMFPALSKIKRWRKTLGLTQEELARAAGVSQSTIAKIEKGLTVPSYPTAVRIFSVLLKYMREEEQVAAEVMSSPVLTVSVNDPLKVAVRVMRENGISQLPVLDNGVVVGGLTEDCILEREALVLSDRCGDVMCASFPTVPPHLPLSSFISLLEVVPAVLVIEKKELKGIITKADVLQNVVKHF